MERTRKKKKWENGLSITPFITQKKDAGDVEKGIDNFNSMMDPGNSGGCMAMSEGAMKDLYMDVQEVGKDNYIRRQKLKLKNRQQKYSQGLPEKRKQELLDEIEDIEAKISVVENQDRKPPSQEEIQNIKNKIYQLKKELQIDPDKEPYDWRPYVERKIARLEAKLKSYGLKENKMEFKHLHEDLDNVTEVEDKAKEVMDPTFASAVREIRSHDKGREELKKLRKAPKEGEESLPKDLKLKLDESYDYSSKEGAKSLKGQTLEFPNGEVLTIDFKDGKLIAGGVTNAGVIPEFELEYDDDFSTDWNLQVLYDLCIESRPELLGEITESKKPLKEEVSDEAYEVAEYINSKADGEEFIEYEEFNGLFNDAVRNLGVTREIYQDNDFESDVRGILANNGWETIYEGEDEGGLERLSADKPSANEIIYNALREYEENHNEFENRTWQKVINKLIDYYDMHMTDEHDIDRYDESLKENYENKRAFFTDGETVLCVDSKDKVFTTMRFGETFERPDVKKVDTEILNEIMRTYIQAGWEDNWYGGIYESKKSKEPKKIFTVKRKNIKEGVTARRFPCGTQRKN